MVHQAMESPPGENVSNSTASALPLQVSVSGSFGITQFCEKL